MLRITCAEEERLARISVHYTDQAAPAVPAPVTPVRRADRADPALSGLATWGRAEQYGAKQCGALQQKPNDELAQVWRAAIQQSLFGAQSIERPQSAPLQPIWGPRS